MSDFLAKLLLQGREATGRILPRIPSRFEPGDPARLDVPPPGIGREADGEMEREGRGALRHDSVSDQGSRSTPGPDPSPQRGGEPSAILMDAARVGEGGREVAPSGRSREGRSGHGVMDPTPVPVAEAPSEAPARAPSLTPRRVRPEVVANRENPHHRSGGQRPGEVVRPAPFGIEGEWGGPEGNPGRSVHESTRGPGGGAGQDARMPGRPPVDRSGVDRTGVDHSGVDRGVFDRTGVERHGVARPGVEPPGARGVPEPLHPPAPGLRAPDDSRGQQAPVIRVSIGRIELRATLPQQGAPRPAPPPAPPPQLPRRPALSLEAYLARRGGEK